MKNILLFLNIFIFISLLKMSNYISDQLNQLVINLYNTDDNTAILITTNTIITNSFHKLPAYCLEKAHAIYEKIMNYLTVEDNINAIIVINDYIIFYNTYAIN